MRSHDQPKDPSLLPQAKKKIPGRKAYFFKPAKKSKEHTPQKSWYDEPWNLKFPLFTKKR